MPLYAGKYRYSGHLPCFSIQQYPVTAGPFSSGEYPCGKRRCVRSAQLGLRGHCYGSPFAGAAFGNTFCQFACSGSLSFVFQCDVLKGWSHHFLAHRMAPKASIFACQVFAGKRRRTKPCASQEQIQHQRHLVEDFHVGTSRNGDFLKGGVQQQVEADRRRRR